MQHVADRNLTLEWVRLISLLGTSIHTSRLHGKPLRIVEGLKLVVSEFYFLDRGLI